MNLGDFEIHSISDGHFRLDGGAMFGVVPRTLWEKTNPPDEKNRILLGINPLLIRTPDLDMIVDTGIGQRWDEKSRAIYGIDRDPTLGESLGRLGMTEGDIDVVINTHLHFDHAGGNTVAEGGSMAPAFKSARYIAQRGEWEDALNPNERTRASYRPGDFVPVMEAGQLDLIDGDKEITPGVKVLRTGGHDRNMQVVLVESRGETALYPGDIIPTVTHLSYPYIMGYDLFPAETLRIKKELIAKAAAERWLVVFEHDPESRMGYVALKDGKPVFEKVL